MNDDRPRVLCVDHVDCECIDHIVVREKSGRQPICAYCDNNNRSRWYIAPHPYLGALKSRLACDDCIGKAINQVREHQRWRRIKHSVTYNMWPQIERMIEESRRG